MIDSPLEICDPFTNFFMECDEMPKAPRKIPHIAAAISSQCIEFSHIEDFKKALKFAEMKLRCEIYAEQPIACKLLIPPHNR